jgi:hypothetical protein
MHVSSFASGRFYPHHAISRPMVLAALTVCKRNGFTTAS